MASWQDGAAYAPIEPPNGFACPVVAPLAAPPTEHDIAADAPLRQPETFTAPGGLTPLERIEPTATQPRNPRIPFAFDAEALGKKAQWLPTDPITPQTSTASGAESAWGAVGGYRIGHDSAVVGSGLAPLGVTNDTSAQLNGQSDFWDDLLDYCNWPMVALLLFAAIISIPRYGQFGWAAMIALSLATAFSWQSKAAAKVAQIVCLGAMAISLIGTIYIGLESRLGTYAYWVVMPEWASATSGIALACYLVGLSFILALGRHRGPGHKG